MKTFFKGLALAGLIAISVLGNAKAQQATPIQQTGTRLDAAIGMYGQANGATSCNTVSQTATQDTVTITPPSGQYVYITGLYIKNTFDATGVTQTGTISTTNISSSGGLAPFFSFGSVLSTVGPADFNVYSFATPLKSAQAGTAVTFVPSATQSAHNYLCMQVAAYFAP